MDICIPFTKNESGSVIVLSLILAGACALLLATVHQKVSLLLVESGGAKGSFFSEQQIKKVRSSTPPLVDWNRIFSNPKLEIIDCPVKANHKASSKKTCDHNKIRVDDLALVKGNLISSNLTISSETGSPILVILGDLSASSTLVSCGFKRIEIIVLGNAYLEQLQITGCKKVSILLHSVVGSIEIGNLTEDYLSCYEFLPGLRLEAEQEISVEGLQIGSNSGIGCLQPRSSYWREEQSIGYHPDWG